MTADEIKKALNERGYSLAMLGRASDINPARFSTVIHRHESSRRVAGLVAKALDKPLTEVFPEYLQQEQARSLRLNKLNELKQRLVS